MEAVSVEEPLAEAAAEAVRPFEIEDSSLRYS